MPKSQLNFEVGINLKHIYMKNEINNFSKENLSNFLATFIEHNNLDLNEVAKSINCSLPTLERINC